MATFCSPFYTPFCAFSLSKLTTKRAYGRWNFRLETAYLPMDPFAAVIQAEVVRWAKFVKETGLRID